MKQHVHGKCFQDCVFQTVHYGKALCEQDDDWRPNETHSKSQKLAVVLLKKLHEWLKGSIMDLERNYHFQRHHHDTTDQDDNQHFVNFLDYRVEFGLDHEARHLEIKEKERGQEYQDGYKVEKCGYQIEQLVIDQFAVKNN